MSSALVLCRKMMFTHAMLVAVMPQISMAEPEMIYLGQGIPSLRTDNLVQGDRCGGVDKECVNLCLQQVWCRAAAYDTNSESCGLYASAKLGDPIVSCSSLNDPSKPRIVKDQNGNDVSGDFSTAFGISTSAKGDNYKVMDNTPKYQVYVKNGYHSVRSSSSNSGNWTGQANVVSIPYNLHMLMGSVVVGIL